MNASFAPDRQAGHGNGPRFPAEWEPCEAVWLAWPHNRSTWPGRFEPILPAMAHFAERIAESTPVRVLVGDRHVRDCRQHVAAIDGVDLVPIDTDDCWVRDYGPVFVIEDGELVGVDFRFNAWGGRYQPYGKDAAAGRQMCQHAGIRRRGATLTVEGGALETDGQGRLLANPACFIDPKRNPGLTKEAVSRAMYQLLGITEIVWIDGGVLAGDDTGGHIDQLARFLDPENVVVSVASDPTDEAAEGLRNNFLQLDLWSTQTSPEVTVHQLPTPPPRRIEGQRVPESYCNFLRLGPERLLVPTFHHDPTDSDALDRLTQWCPGVDVVGVPCEDLVWGLGALHCASSHQPAT
ncbi:MAG: agmatine deiminase family protein [Planctomycetota bacterium]